MAPQCPAVITYHLLSELLLTLNPVEQVTIPPLMPRTIPTPPRSGGSQSHVGKLTSHSHVSVSAFPDHESRVSIVPRRRLAALTAACCAAFNDWPRGNCSSTSFLSTSSADANPVISPLPVGGFALMIAPLSQAWACSSSA